VNTLTKTLIQIIKRTKHSLNITHGAKFVCNHVSNQSFAVGDRTER